jgi:pimeloyl-ACP methyl ester carboxylesterase
MSPRHQPTIVFVNGAWHSPAFFDKVISILKAADYKCVTVVMPGIGQSPPVTSLDEDIAAVRSAVKKELDLGNDVMMHAHSQHALCRQNFSWSRILTIVFH